MVVSYVGDVGEIDRADEVDALDQVGRGDGRTEWCMRGQDKGMSSECSGQPHVVLESQLSVGFGSLALRDRLLVTRGRCWVLCLFRT